MNGDPQQEPAQEPTQQPAPKPEDVKDASENKEGCVKSGECTKSE